MKVLWTEKGKSAMTRQSIALLVGLIVGLFIVFQVTAVTAHDVCGDPPGQWCMEMPIPDTASLLSMAQYSVYPDAINGSVPIVATSDVICHTEPTAMPLCYTLLSDGTKVMASVRPDWTGLP
jgi:hypothetical protein